jgi:predicted GIY-YIG superfamily endonuclease
MEGGDESCVNPHHFLARGKKPLGGEAIRTPYGSSKRKKKPSAKTPDFYASSLVKPFNSPRVQSTSSFLIDSDPGLPCVYAIRCRANGGLYVGKAKDLTRRSHQHSGKLGRNSHVNRRLQLDWNKYGAQSFFMEVLEVCQTNAECIARETEVIREFSVKAPSRLYNIMGNNLSAS